MDVVLFLRYVYSVIFATSHFTVKMKIYGGFKNRLIEKSAVCTKATSFGGVLILQLQKCHQIQVNHEWLGTLAGNTIKSSVECRDKI